MMHLLRNTQKVSNQRIKYSLVRSLSTALKEESPLEELVKLDHYSHRHRQSPPKEEIRLPNDVHERNNLYKNESARVMNGITGVVRHVSYSIS